MLSLNKEQKIACTAPLGYNLVIASAGTGKTSTIVGRIAYLIQQGISPKEILLLTFTNKAAQEMLSRLQVICDNKQIKEIEAGTFHAVSYRYLKEHKNITLKRISELKVLFKNVYDSCIFKQNNEVNPYSSSYLFDIYSLYQNSHQYYECYESFSEWLSNRMDSQCVHVAIYEEIINAFEALKQQYGYAGFNDLLILYREEMKNKRLQKDLYKEVLVDEYQDTNPLQDSVLMALDPKSLFCVGDYDQSIYAFNGADISIIAGFEDRFYNAKIFNLSKNYRSTEPILNIANKVISYNKRIYPKKIEATKISTDAKEVKLLVYDELFQQYYGIAKRISCSSTKHSEIAVIFRNNASADAIEACLKEWNIPSKRKGGISFFDAKEVTLMLDILSLFHNPKDMMAFIHIISYIKGVGGSVSMDIYHALVQLGDGNILRGLLHPRGNINDILVNKGKYESGLFDDLFKQEKTAKWDNLGLHKDFVQNPLLQHPKITVNTVCFLNNLYILALAFKPTQSTMQLIEHCEASLLFKDITAKLAKTRATLKDGSCNAEQYKYALEKIAFKIKILKDLSKNYSELGRFLNAMILGASEMSEGDGVNLLSVHSSKGLEYSEVYVIDLMEGRFPNRKLMVKNGNLDEERRLFYVAVTRAKDILALSFAKNDSRRKVAYEPSVFLREAGFNI